MKQPGSDTKKKRKKVTWSDHVYITVDTETAFYAATKPADIFAIVDDTQIPITLLVPFRPDAAEAETTQNAAKATLDATEATPAVEQCTTPNMPAQTTSVVSTETIQRLRTGQTFNSQKLPTTQATCQKVPDDTQPSHRMRRNFCYNPYRQN